jgi:hypothetical protein
MALPDESALDDETRRIMLHLSVEPVATTRTASKAIAPEKSLDLKVQPSRFRRWVKSRRATKA